ncbi:MAG: DUF11 domain-containing protein, partial [Propionibacteriaceae bacterium]|nr:DUF11 domain-containing protein [Propionibacteriaceae bacterium]
MVLAVLLAPPPQARAQVVTSADLSVTLSDSPDPVVSGSNITYTITLTNGGPDPADTVNVTMAVPANTTFVSATPNGVGWSTSAPAVGATGNIVFSKPTVAVGSETFTVVVNVNPTTLNGSTISATATVASNTPDPDGSGPSDTETTGVIAPDLTISKTGPAIVTAGATTANYTVTVTNAGGASASNI